MISEFLCLLQWHLSLLSLWHDTQWCHPNVRELKPNSGRTRNLQESAWFTAAIKVKLYIRSFYIFWREKCFSHIFHLCHVFVLLLIFRVLSAALCSPLFSVNGPVPCRHWLRPVTREMEEVVVEVVRVFIKQTVKGFGGSIETWNWNGDATERAALPNELEWPIEARAFSQKPRRTKCQNKPSPSSFRGAKRRLLTLWSVGIWSGGREEKGGGGRMYLLKQWALKSSTPPCLLFFSLALLLISPRLPIRPTLAQAIESPHISRDPQRRGFGGFASL